MGLKNLIGKVFGRLTVLGLANDSYPYRWNCQCSCGATKIVAGKHLASGNTTSCGCFRSEVAKSNNTTHGMKGSTTYSTWRGILTRCCNPKSENYDSYGGAGITICERWKTFENFYADMGEKPKGLTIDRIDGAGNYELSNCRWATHKEQQNNLKSNKLLTFNGKTQSMSMWADEAGVPYDRFQRRLIYGWSMKDALTLPLRARRKNNV